MVEGAGGGKGNGISEMTFAVGTRLGHYEIRSQLGAGGMGEVYLARTQSSIALA